MEAKGSDFSRIKLAFEQSPDAVIFADTDGAIQLWNSSAEDIFGVSKEEALGKSLDIIIPEYLRESHWKGFHRAIAANSTKYEKLPLTTRALHRNRPTLFIDLTFSILRDDKNKVVGALAHARDVTSRHLSEQALKEGELSLGFFSVNQDWTFTFLNREARRLFGAEALLGECLWENFPKLKGSRFQEKLFRALGVQNPIHFEDFLEPLARWVEVHAFPSPVGLAVYIRDINRQKQLEEELHASEHRFRLLVQGAQGYSFVIYDNQGRVISWNAGAARLYQYSENEIIGQSCDLFFSSADIEKGRPAAILAAAAQNGRYEEEGLRTKKDGTRFWASVSVTPISDAQGNRTGFCSLTRDMTDKRKLEEERMQLLKEAQEAVAARDEFLSIASHDLKSPLGAFYMQQQLMQMEVQALASELAGNKRIETLVKLVEIGERQCKRLSNLMDQLLDFTRIRMGRMKLNLMKYNLSQDAAEILNSMRDQAAQRGSELSVNISPDVIGIWDQGRMSEVLTNLVSNAIKYGEGKPILVTLDNLPDRKGVLIKVSDKGAGISKAMHERIFNRFERVTTRKDIAGLGLGLYIVHQIVEAHGGTIRVESELGQGSTFIVEIPFSFNVQILEEAVPN